MVGRKSGRAANKEEGLQRTDNSFGFSTWPVANMINQKNYYTEYLKRDDQVLVLRLQNEENRNKLARVARDRDRALAQSDHNGVNPPDVDMDADETLAAEEGAESGGDSEAVGSKVIVIHPGSQNLRIGLASDALPKTIPMVVARKTMQKEPETLEDEPKPKRRRIGDSPSPDPQAPFGPEFAAQFVAFTTELKGRMRKKGRRIVPNSREVAVNYNRRSEPVIIPEHNDTQRIDWTETSDESAAYFTGQAALRIPDTSNPKYKLSWPLKYGTFNESDYQSKEDLLRDFAVIIEEAIKAQLGLSRRKDWSQYGCVFVVPDLYDRLYVTTVLDVLFRDFGFARVCFIQESLSGSFGAGFSTCVIVDVGATKTSICCVDEGMCVEQSRINLRYGGADVTETFVRMLLSNQFPYADLDLRRRHDFLLAEELKTRFSTLDSAVVAVTNREFHLRVFEQKTRHYLFKTYDEVMLPAMGYYKPEIFDHSEKLSKRHHLFGRSQDLYDASPNDPTSSAQMDMFAWAQKNYSGRDDSLGSNETTVPGITRDGPSSRPKSLLERDIASRATQDSHDSNEASEALKAGGLATPVLDDKDTTMPQENGIDLDTTDRILPCMPLDQAILLSIQHGAKGDERKMRDFFGGIIPIGGGAQISGFLPLLEEELREAQPRFQKELLVGPPPREIDPQVLIWKGASVFGKLQGTNDSWISAMEYDRLGNRLLAYKCLWNW